MVKIQEKLQEKYRLDAFLRKAIFEGSQAIPFPLINKSDDI